MWLNVDNLKNVKITIYKCIDVEVKQLSTHSVDSKFYDILRRIFWKSFDYKHCLHWEWIDDKQIDFNETDFSKKTKNDGTFNFNCMLWNCTYINGDTLIHIVPFAMLCLDDCVISLHETIQCDFLKCRISNENSVYWIANCDNGSWSRHWIHLLDYIFLFSIWRIKTQFVAS